MPIGDVPYFSNICGLNANEAWASGVDNNTYESFIQHTTDGGQTWERQLQDGFSTAFSYVNFVHFWDAQRGIAVGDAVPDSVSTAPYFEIYQTYDGGQNWQRVARDSILPNDPLPGEYGVGGSYQVVGNHVWFSTTNGRIFRSVNGGQSWLGLETGAASYINRFSFADSLSGVIYNGSLRRTEDGGLSWTPINAPYYPGNMVSLSLIPQSKYILAVIMDQPVSGPFRTVISKDAGETWQVLSETENACVAQFISPTAGYAGEWQPATHATRMYSYNGNPLSGIFSGKALQAELEIYPNPTAHILKVNVKTEQTGEFLLLLNDTAGRLVGHQKVANTGQFSTSFNMRYLPAGIYLLTVSNANGSLTKLIVKQ